MKTTDAIIILLAIALLTGCATLAAQPQPVDESQAVAKAPQTKPVDAYVFIPRNAADQKETKATITGDGGEIRWIPLKITVNVPVPKKTEATVEGDKKD